MKTNWLFFFMMLFSVSFYGQQTVYVKGKVIEADNGKPLTIATVTVLNTSEIVITDAKGDFVLELKEPLPIEIEISALGFNNYKYIITQREENITIKLKEGVTSLDAIVLSASRTPESVFESPVSIERMGTKQIESTTSATFYDGLENLKGVDVNASSLTFKSINTRGFATFANTRFVQLVDGMDNSSPGLNFPLGNLIGLNELDVQSVELLPGASSALYGANAFNGILFMRSKSPFSQEGTSVYGKTGVTSSENAGTNEFVDVGIRVAKKITDQFAVKFTSSLLKATDWFATDTRNINDDGKIVAGNRDNALDYNGINVYGDEFTNPTDLGFGKVSRTGYNEQSVINPDTDSFRAAIALHWKPFKDNDDTEIIYSSKYGTGNTIYQGASRYAMRNFVMHQHKLEIQSKHLMLRSYTTIEDAGDSYDIRFAGINTLRTDNAATKAYNQANGTSLSVDELWFGAYGQAYVAALGGGANDSDARVIARSQADAAFRTDPNSAEFRSIFNSVIKNPDLTQGAKFEDESRLYHTDLNYNFHELIDFAEVQVGGSARRYVLGSNGTIFTDPSGVKSISYDEFGVYTQLQKKLMEDRLKLTGSIRYDKAQNFEGNFSPRVSVTFSPDTDKKHVFRTSYQTGFRNPTTQDQYIGLNLGNTILIGSAPDNPIRYNKMFDISSPAGQSVVGSSVNFNGLQGYNNSFTRSSVVVFSAAVAQRATAIVVGSGGAVSASDAKKQAAAENVGLLKKANINYVKPEQVTSYELGYRGKLGKYMVVDVSTYYNNYKDFISIVTTVAPLYGNISAIVGPAQVSGDVNTQLLLNAVGTGEYTPTSIYTNTNADVAAYGANVGIEAIIFGGFDFGINYSYAKQDFDQSEDPDFETSFNTPEHKVKISFGKADMYKGLGFGINGRWQDAYYWESTYVDGMVDGRTLLDAQLMYTIENWNSNIKIGGANILGNEYEAAPGAGTIGSQFYGSWTYNF